MFFKRALVATAFAWLVGALCFPFFIWAAFKVYGMNVSLARCLSDGLMLTLFFVTPVVFVTCLMVVTPLLKWLPPASIFWRPGPATGVGAAFGPVAMFLWETVSSGRYSFVETLRELRFPEPKAAMVTAVAVGATFGYVVARLNAAKPAPPSEIV